MKNLVKLALSAVLTILLSVSVSNAQFGYIIDHVDGAYNNDIRPGIPFTMHLKLQNYSDAHVAVIITGFRFYLSNNGEIPNGEFQVIQYDTTLVDWNLKFNWISSFNTFSFDGFGADTLSIGQDGLGWYEERGFAPGYDSVVMTFTTTVDASFAGDSLCIDSSYFPPTGEWLWFMRDTTGFFQDPPNWGGPYCYEILPSCCIGISGNVDSDETDEISVSDLNVLVQYMFLGGPPPLCFDEADINNDGQLHIQDIVDMVAYMFQGGQAPATCP